MKKKIKTILITLLAGVLAFGLTSCAGKSAYEIACENGFVGSEQDWLLSLKGADGKDAQDVTVGDLYEAWLAEGNEGSIEDFFDAYLSLNVGTENDLAIIQQNLTSVVTVYSSFPVVTEEGPEIKYSLGSGVIIDLHKSTGDAIILTNYHCIFNAKSTVEKGRPQQVGVYLYGGLIGVDGAGNFAGDVVHASIVGAALSYDIAVLKVEGSNLLKNSCATQAQIGTSENIVVGQKVRVIGNAEGEGISVAEGEISVDSQYITLNINPAVGTLNYRVMRTSAPINHGNSGGGLFDAQGRLVGINNAKNTDEDVENMGYALPIDQVMRVVDNILDNGGVCLQARMGVMVQTTSASAVLDSVTGKLKVVETLVISTVSFGSAASVALSAGDKLVSIEVGGVTYPIERRYHLGEYLLDVRQGDSVKITVLRGGVSVTKTVTFDSSAYFEAM